MQLKNRIEDYLETIKPDTAGITCPACGSVLGIRRQGSTDMVLTQNVRLELDGNLNSYRLFLEKIEAILEQRTVYYKGYAGNYPYDRELRHYQRGEKLQIEFKPDGNYTGIIAELVSNSFVEMIDFFEWIKNFYSFPRVDKDKSLNQMNGEEAKLIYQKTKGILVTGLEPRSIAGPLVDIIFDQKYVSTWQQKVLKNPENMNKLAKLLEEICPAIDWYLKILMDINSKNPDNQTNPQNHEQLKDGITRIKFILAIVLGHRTQNNELLTDLFIEADSPFTLPRKTVIAPKYLGQLLCSEIVLGNCKIGLSQNLLQKLKKELNNGQRQGNDKTVEEVVKNLNNEIDKFVHFCCSGPVSKNPDQKSEDRRDLSKTAYIFAEENCGWYPKLEPTHPVILLGSPGTGKSSVMLTGFTTFYENIYALGATINFESPEDEARMNSLYKDYSAGIMPKPTSKGDRTTIKLSIEFPVKGYPRTHFVFTDVAGEVMARSLTAEGSDPAILRILKNAETIIFFFDISIEPSIRQKLTEGDDGTWQKLDKSVKRVFVSRANNQQNVKDTSRAEVSQIQLLGKLIQDLRVQRGENDLKNDGVNFICVIPKMDLFADETEGDRYFFTKFLKDLQLQDILVRSHRGNEDESFQGMRSIGGTSAKIPDQTSRKLIPDNGIEDQKILGKWISQKTLTYLSKVKQALDPQTPEPIKDSLQYTLDVGLVKTLNYNFGEDNVYFLPVSAQGKDSDNLNFGSAPNQKLSEYVFILPVVLSINNNGQSSEEQNKKSAFPWS